MTLEELLARCKGPVSLEVNQHRGFYNSTIEAIAEINHFREVAHSPPLDDELVTRMLVEDRIVRLTFYPDTPVSFYDVFGTSVAEVLREAAECLAEEGTEEPWRDEP